MTRDWNPAPKHDAPAPKEALLELRAWKDAKKKKALLDAGLPLPPELRSPEAQKRIAAAEERKRLTAAGEIVAEAPAAGTLLIETPKQRCTIRGRTQAEFLKNLEEECAIEWPADEDS